MLKLCDEFTEANNVTAIDPPPSDVLLPSDSVKSKERTGWS